VTPGAQGASSTLTISIAASAAVFKPFNQLENRNGWKIVGTSGARIAALSGLGAILSLLMLSRSERNLRVRYAWLAAVLFVALLQTACGGAGGGSSAPPTTPPESGSQTYTVTVTGVSTTATSVKIQHAATITVTVP
jgi:hypothetical protein